MRRSFHPADLIDLPRLDGPGMVAVGRQILRRARADKNFPASAKKALARFAAALAKLERTVKKKEVQPLQDSTGRKQADRAEDEAWAMLHDLVSTWERMPEGHPRQILAGDLKKAVFADGLHFTKARYEAEWSSADAKLQVLARPEVEGAVVELGGGEMLAHLRAVHQDYGVALGITADAAPLTLPVAIAEPLKAARDELKGLVVALSASIDPEHPASGERVEILLAPLADRPGRRVLRAAPAPPVAAKAA